MSTYSDDTIRDEELISSREQEEYEEDANENESIISLEENEHWVELQKKIEKLQNKYEIVKSIMENQQEEKNLAKEENKKFLSEEEEIKNNSALLKEILLQNSFYKTQILELKNLNTSILRELEKSQIEVKEKSNEILTLRQEMEIIKSERDENIYQVKSILKDFDVYGNSMRHTVNRESISTIASIGAFSSNNNTLPTSNIISTNQSNQDHDKAQSALENQLVMYKLKYAELSSKVMELEDEKEVLRKRNDDSVEKIKLKDEIIKNLISERDSLKYGRSSIKNTISIPALNTKAMTRSPETKNRGLQFDERIYMQTEVEEANGKCINQGYYLNTDRGGMSSNSAVSGSKTPGAGGKGFVKILKNIFISDKKN